MQNMILVLHLLIAVVLVGAVLMQRSEGGALGMGGGGTGGLISGRGAADMMVRITGWVGGAFFVTSLLLAVLAGVRPADRSVIDEDGARKGGFNFQIPGLPGSQAPASDNTVLAPAAITPPPAGAAGAPIGAGPLAPAPDSAVTRAGPLSAQPDSQPAASKAPRASTPIGASPSAGAPAGPVGSGTATKAGAAAPMIPLPAATTPAPAPASTTESDQSSAPAPPTPTREKTGPDE